MVKGNLHLLSALACAESSRPVVRRPPRGGSRGGRHAKHGWRRPSGPIPCPPRESGPRAPHLMPHPTRRQMLHGCPRTALPAGWGTRSNRQTGSSSRKHSKRSGGWKRWTPPRPHHSSTSSGRCQSPTRQRAREGTKRGGPTGPDSCTGEGEAISCMSSGEHFHGGSSSPRFTAGAHRTSKMSFECRVKRPNAECS
jgi:hypothetical protein